MLLIIKGLFIAIEQLLSNAGIQTCAILSFFPLSKSALDRPRRNGVVVRAVACEARGPGFDSSYDQMVFFSPRVQGGRNKMDPDTINYVILRIHVDKNYNINS